MVGKYFKKCCWIFVQKLWWINIVYWQQEINGIDQHFENFNNSMYIYKYEYLVKEIKIVKVV